MRLLMGFVAFSCLVPVGCAPAKRDISGKVTYDGQALKDGLIVFENTNKDLGGVSADIKDGAYSIKVIDGTYKVRITAQKLVPLPKGKVGMYGEKEGHQQFLPAKYNTGTELNAEIAGEKSVDFTLKPDVNGKKK